MGVRLPPWVPSVWIKYVAGLAQEDFMQREVLSWVKRKLQSKAQKQEVFGAYLRDMRVAAGLTQVQVADELGYSTAQFVSNFERGVCLPSIKKMEILISLYNLHAKEVVKMLLSIQESYLQSMLSLE